MAEVVSWVPRALVDELTTGALLDTIPRIEDLARRAAAPRHASIERDLR
jgi:hypothetical protein